MWKLRQASRWGGRGLPLALLVVMLVFSLGGRVAAQAAIVDFAAEVVPGSQMIRLTWRTTQETAGQVFVIDRTADQGAHWETLVSNIYTDGAPKAYDFFDSYQDGEKVIGYKLTLRVAPYAPDALETTTFVLTIESSPTSTITSTITPTASPELTATPTPTATATPSPALPLPSATPTGPVALETEGPEGPTPSPEVTVPVAPGRSQLAANEPEVPSPAPPPTVRPANTTVRTPTRTATVTATRTLVRTVRPASSAAHTPAADVLASNTNGTEVQERAVPAAPVQPAAPRGLFVAGVMAIALAVLLGVAGLVIWLRIK